MAALYAIGAVWAVVAGVVLLVAILVLPPRDVRQWGAALEVALGWPWFLGRAVVGQVRAVDLERLQ